MVRDDEDSYVNVALSPPKKYRMSAGLRINCVHVFFASARGMTKVRVHNLHQHASLA